jgi:hypothetical protein
MSDYETPPRKSVSNAFNVIGGIQPFNCIGFYEKEVVSSVTRIISPCTVSERAAPTMSRFCDKERSSRGNDLDKVMICDSVDPAKCPDYPALTKLIEMTIINTHRFVGRSSDTMQLESGI